MTFLYYLKLLFDQELSSKTTQAFTLLGLSPKAKEFDVERFFKGFGKTLKIDLKQGFGFIKLDNAKEADDAGYEINNNHYMVGKSLLRKLLQ